MTLHPYLYCLNDPINATDPSGKFLGIFGSMWARAKDAAVSVGIKKSVEETIINGVSVWNGMTQGYINMLFGPDDMSDKAKFWTGFAAGSIEIQVGMRTGSATLGAFAASTVTSALNSAFSGKTDFISGGTAVNIILSTGMGAFGDWASDSAIDAVTMWAIGVDAAMAGGLGQMAYDLRD